MGGPVAALCKSQSDQPAFQASKLDVSGGEPPTGSTPCLHLPIGISGGLGVRLRQVMSQLGGRTQQTAESAVTQKASE